MSAAHSSEQAHGAHGAGPGHVVNPLILVGVLVVLLVLTLATVAVTWVDLGEFNLLVAMIIAVIKGSLVCLFFMHMYWDKPIVPIVFISSLLLVGLFIGLASVDYGQYKPDLIEGYAPKIEAEAGAAAAPAPAPSPTPTAGEATTPADGGTTAPANGSDATHPASDGTTPAEPGATGTPTEGSSGGH